MEIFKPSNETHNLKVIPRYYVENCSILIRHELTDLLTNIENAIVYCENGYIIVPFSFQFKEGGSYQMELLTDTQTIWRGKAYATNQNGLENYKLL